MHICYINTDSSLTQDITSIQTENWRMVQGLTGERCTFFILKNYSSMTPRSKKTNGSFDDPNEGQGGKRERSPMDERIVLTVKDCEE